eukprot:1022550-Alexandrium_andersonii.AAC.1
MAKRIRGDDHACCASQRRFAGCGRADARDPAQVVFAAPGGHGGRQRRRPWRLPGDQAHPGAPVGLAAR